jgi:hypothetical protein
MDTTKYAELYATHYDKQFKKLSKSLQDRVLACKLDNNLKDVEVEAFIKLVIDAAEAEEATLEAKEVTALLAANKQLQLNETKI